MTFRGLRKFDKVGAKVRALEGRCVAIENENANLRGSLTESNRVLNGIEKENAKLRAQLKAADDRIGAYKKAGAQ